MTPSEQSHRDREADVMGRKAWWLALVLVAVLGGGCAGIIAQSVQDDGRVERLRVQGGEKWSSIDRNPLKEDGTCIMLKKESTF
jgi:hypothetical protein